MGGRSGSVAIVIPQLPTEPLAATDLGPGSIEFLTGFDERVAQPLVIALSMVMRKEFPNRVTQRFLTEEDHSIEALFLDRSDEAFDVRVQIR